MYSVSNNRAYINGSSGCYDNQIKNNSVRYGRNAIANQKIYLSDLGSKIGTPINFELNYQPKSTKKGNVDFMALLGSAYEEMGKKVSICLKEFNDNLQNTFGTSENQVSIDALDINGDNKIDLSEYATSTLIFDMLSIDGKIILHIGSKEPSKEEAINRFIENFNKLDTSVPPSTLSLKASLAAPFLKII